MSDEKRSASLSGAGRLSGGDYTRVSISGAGKVAGDLKAEELRISGAGKVDGNVEATQVSVSGGASFAGTVTADEMSVSGAARIGGAAKVKELKCSGTFRVAKSIAAEYVKVSGHIHVEGDLEAEIFKATGGFTIDGLLTADRIEVKLGGKCYAREIGGEKIEILRGGFRERGILFDGLVRMFAGSGMAELKAASIEGDDVHLEDTTADVVRGKRVRIGPGCHIGSLEYSESADVHESAKIDRKTRV
ncbi:MAG: polymer-forming cytoskeletal protein [Candidatus Bipolaricaulota bacterium]